MLKLLGFYDWCSLLVIGKRERRATNDLLERPALELRQRTRFADADDIADACRVLLVVSIKLFVRLHDALVLGMRLAHLDLNDDRFLHLGRDDKADLLIATRGLGFWGCGCGVGCICHD